MSFLESLRRSASRLVKASPGAIPDCFDVPDTSFVIIVDRSGSMAEPCGTVTRLDAAKEAVASLLDSRIRCNTNDRVTLLTFNTWAEIRIPFAWVSQARHLLEPVLRGVHAHGGTDLRAPLLTVQQLLAGRNLPPTHLIVMTDGHGGDPRATATVLKEQGVVIETIGIGNTHDDVDEQLLKRVASIHEGHILYRFIHDRGELVEYFQNEIAGRLVK